MKRYWNFIFFLSMVCSCETGTKNVETKAELQKVESYAPNDAIYPVEKEVKAEHFPDKDILPGNNGKKEGVLKIVVDNVNDFYRNIGPNRILLLKPGNYYLDEIDSTLKNEYCEWATVLFDEIISDPFSDDDATLLVSGLENFSIKAYRKKEKTQILTRKLTASVMAFNACENVSMSHLFFGHENETLSNPHEAWVSYCSGEVLEFFDCKNIVLEKLDLFGCGTLGFLAHRCEDFKVYESHIHDCTYGAFGIFDSQNVEVSDVKIHNNRVRVLMEVSASKNVLFQRISIKNNRIADEYFTNAFEIVGSIIKADELLFENNEFSHQEFLDQLEN